jgi:hypothetical protein
MNTVLIIPTGVGAELGGHAGDGNPVAKLIGAVSDILVTHPNVVNASDINEMPENTWYVEGSMLDRFLDGDFCLKQPLMNKILLAVNKPIRPETVNAVNSARMTIGADISIVELETPLRMEGFITEQGADGRVYGWQELITEVCNHEFDALAIATPIKCEKETALNYLRNGGINPWGRVEAIASKLISEELHKPVAHAPIENEDPDLKDFNEVVDPRIAAEAISQCYVHSVFKGLHRAPRLSLSGLGVEDIHCLITPVNCVGAPHTACVAMGIPVIAVKENKTCLNDPMPDSFILVENYLEAAGVLLAMKAGVTPESVRRPATEANILYD